MGLAGAAGGFCRRLLMTQTLRQRMALFGAAGLILTLNYQICVNSSFYFFSLWEIKQAFVPYLISGLIFSLMHLVSNGLIFAFVAAPAAPRLKILFHRILPAAAILILCLTAVPASAEPASDALDYSVWDKTYYQDGADLFRFLPGFFHYDLALPGQPQYLVHRQNQIAVTIFGLPQNSALTGSYDLLQLSPGYIQTIESDQSAVDGVISAAGVVELRPEKIDPSKPYSRVNYRDGYYGFGAADFVFAQRLSKAYTLQAGGRVSEFNGRFANSKQNGEKFHGSMFYFRPEGWNFQLTFLSHHNRGEITHTSDRRLFLRQDLFLLGENSSPNPISFAGQHYTSEDDYYNKPDALEQAYRFRLSQKRNLLGFKLEPALFLEWYSVHLSGFAERQASAAAAVQAHSQLFSRLINRSAVSLASGRELLLNLASVFEYKLADNASTALTCARTQQPALPLCRIYGLTAEDYFLPASPLWALPPAAQIEPNYELQPQTIESINLSGQFLFGTYLRFKPAIFHQRQFDCFSLQPSSPGCWRWVNLPYEQLSGGEAGLEFADWRGFSGHLNWTYQNPPSTANFIPHHWGFISAAWQHKFYQGDLDFTVEIHGSYIASRAGEIGGSHHNLGDDNVWGLLLLYSIGDFTFFWGNENIFSRQYEIIPGYEMIHREEVWGINWIFWD